MRVTALIGALALICWIENGCRPWVCTMPLPKESVAIQWWPADMHAGGRRSSGRSFPGQGLHTVGCPTAWIGRLRCIGPTVFFTSLGELEGQQTL